MYSYLVIETQLYDNALVYIHGTILFSTGVAIPQELDSSFQEFSNSPLPKKANNLAIRSPSCADLLSDLSKHGYRVITSCVTSNQNQPHLSPKMFWTLEKSTEVIEEVLNADPMKTV